MAEKYKSKAELQAENDVLRSGKNINAWSKAFRTFITCITFIVIAVCVRDIGLAWAGKKTEADINILADVKAEGGVYKKKENQKPDQLLCPDTVVKTEVAEYSWLLALAGVVFGFGGITYGRLQSKAKKDAIELYHPRVKKLEEALDPKRSSSELTKRGNTRPEDLE